MAAMVSSELPPYQYEQLPNPRTDIRILVLACQGRTTDSLDILRNADYWTDRNSGKNKLAYECLSYTWDEEPMVFAKEEGLHEGSTDDELDRVSRNLEEDGHFLVLDGYALSIRSSLAKAVARLRRRPCIDGCDEPCARCSRRMWIDFACINQQDLIAERSSQVAAMGRIYHEADHCVIWIGEDSTYHEFRELMRRFQVLLHPEISERISAFPEGDVHSLEELTDLVLADRNFEEESVARLILSRRWFRRLWVVQEFCLSRSSHFSCGPYTLPAHFLLALRRAYTRRDGISWLRPGTMALEACERFVARQAATEEDSLPLWLSTLDFMLRLGALNCSDPRDRVLALIWPFASTFEVDYTKSVEEIYTQFAAQAVRQGSLYEVLECALTLRRSTWKSSARDLPSWVPDWTLRMDSLEIPYLKIMPSDLASRCPSPRVLEISSDCWRVEMIYLGRLTRVIPQDDPMCFVMPSGWAVQPRLHHRLWTPREGAEHHLFCTIERDQLPGICVFEHKAQANADLNTSSSGSREVDSDIVWKVRLLTEACVYTDNKRPGAGGFAVRWVDAEKLGGKKMTIDIA